MAATTDFISATNHRRSSYLVGCMSPSCVPVHEEYTLISSGTRGSNRRSLRWKKLMKKMIDDSRKSIYGASKPVIFRYDAVSYSQNFDEGNRSDDIICTEALFTSFTRMLVGLVSRSAMYRTEIGIGIGIGM
ncbi:hypothetical protein R6Q59_035332 [Mikania micrantha]